MGDTISRTKLREAVAEIRPTINLPNGYPPSRDLVLQPQLVELDMALFSKTAAAGDTHCSACVDAQLNTKFDCHVDSRFHAHVLQHCSDTQACEAPRTAP